MNETSETVTTSETTQARTKEQILAEHEALLKQVGAKAYHAAVLTEEVKQGYQNILKLNQEYAVTPNEPTPPSAA